MLCISTRPVVRLKRKAVQPTGMGALENRIVAVKKPRVSSLNAPVATISRGTKRRTRQSEIAPDRGASMYDGARAPSPSMDLESIGGHVSVDTLMSRYLQFLPSVAL